MLSCPWAPGRWGGTIAKLGVAAPLAGDAQSTCTLASGSGHHSFAGGVLVARFGLELSCGASSSCSLSGPGLLDRNRGDLTSLGKPKDTLPSLGLVGDPGDRGDPRGESLRLCKVPLSLLFDRGEGGPNILSVAPGLQDCAPTKLLSLA